MKIHEYQAKTLFREFGIPVEEHILCADPDCAAAAYDKLEVEQVVVKAQVLTGGRGKAGGVKLAVNRDQVRQFAGEILGMRIRDLPVEKIIVSRAVRIESEYYVCFTIDRNTKSAVLMLSAEGGMEIEQVAARSPEKIYRHTIDPFVGIPDFLAHRFAFQLFKEIEDVRRMAAVIRNLYGLFTARDASLAEINPLVKTAEGELMAIDGKMVFDDNALYRHPDIQALSNLTGEEKVEAGAREKGFSYVGLDGGIGCMVNGAGLAMATMDMIGLYGSAPANFLDIGGSSNPDKVVEAMKLLLAHPRVKVVLINIFGGITRCDDVAAGLIAAFDRLRTDIPVVVRLTGTNDEAGRTMLTGGRFRVARTMAEAVRMAVEMGKE